MAGSESSVSSQHLARVGAGLWAFFGVAFRRQTWYNLVYLLLAFPLGIAYFVFTVVVGAVGGALTIILVGFAVLAVGLVGSFCLIGFEQWLTDRLLAVDVSWQTDLEGEDWRERLSSLVTQRETWTALLYLPSKFGLGLLSFTLSTTAFTTALGVLTVPLYYDRPGLYVGMVPDRAPEVHSSLYLGWNYLLVGFETVFTVGSWRIETLPGALVAAFVGLLMLFGTFHVLNLIARLWGRYARFMLGGCYNLPLALLRSE